MWMNANTLHAPHRRSAGTMRAATAVRAAQDSMEMASNALTLMSVRNRDVVQRKPFVPILKGVTLALAKMASLGTEKNAQTWMSVRTNHAHRRLLV